MKYIGRSVTKAKVTIYILITAILPYQYTPMYLSELKRDRSTASRFWMDGTYLHCYCTPLHLHSNMDGVANRVGKCTKRYFR